MNRKILPISQESTRTDRRRFDSAALEAFDIDPETYLSRIYDGLVELVEQRLAMPRMRKKVAKRKVQVSIDAVKKQVESEILPHGLADFPESFLAQTRKAPMIEIPITGNPLHIGGFFFGSYEILDEDNTKVYEAKSLEMAQYIICAFKPREYIISIPRSRVAIVNAVKEYVRYIRSTYEKLVQRAFSATTDHNIADRIALELLRDNGYSGNFDLTSD